MIIFIIGYKSSGKTTIGKKLANRLGYQFIDIDQYIESKEGRTVPEIYINEGDEKFRAMEWKALKEIVHLDNIVVSTGGGVPCHCDNMNIMREHGTVIYLKLDSDTLVSRLKHATADRPIVKGKTDEQLREYVSDLRDQCEHHYLTATHIIEAKDLKVDDILKILNI